MYQKSTETIVLETLLGDNPYNGQYPTDVVVTPEYDRKKRLRRVHLVIYTDSEESTYSAVLRNPPLLGQKLNSGSFRFSLGVYRPKEVLGCSFTGNAQVVKAFLSYAEKALLEGKDGAQ